VAHSTRAPTHEALPGFPMAGMCSSCRLLQVTGRRRQPVHATASGASGSVRDVATYTYTKAMV